MIAFTEAGLADVPLLLTFIQEFHELDGHPFHPSIVEVVVRELIESPQLGRIWLIRDGAEPVGYAVLGFGYSIEFHGRDAFIDELYLRESHRGRGWGRLAMEFIEGEARKLGIHALHLEATRGNHRAVRLYEQAGFKDNDRFLLTKWL
jgi:diamine N-acetyltransferase